jgi:hypothetical protein
MEFLTPWLRANIFLPFPSSQHAFVLFTCLISVRFNPQALPLRKFPSWIHCIHLSNTFKTKFRWLGPRPLNNNEMAAVLGTSSKERTIISLHTDVDLHEYAIFPFHIYHLIHINRIPNFPSFLSLPLSLSPSLNFIRESRNKHPPQHPIQY